MNKAKHKERFNSVARNYQSERYPGRYNCLLFVLDYLDPSQSDIVLDVGCGPGTQLIDISPLIKFGFGVDLSEEMIKVAGSRAESCKNLEFITSSAEVLPPRLSEVGVTKIYSNYSLHHLSDDQKFKTIDSISKILAPGGMFILGDLMLSEDPSKYSIMYDYVGYGPESDTPSTVSNLEAMFERTGLNSKTRLLNPISGIIIGVKI